MLDIGVLTGMLWLRFQLRCLKSQTMKEIRCGPSFLWQVEHL